MPEQLYSVGARRPRWSLNPIQSALDQLWTDQGAATAVADLVVDTRAWCYPPRWIHWIVLEALKLWKMFKR